MPRPVPSPPAPKRRRHRTGNAIPGDLARLQWSRCRSWSRSRRPPAGVYHAQHQINAGAGGVEAGRTEQVDGVLRGARRDPFQRRRGMGRIAVNQRVEQGLIENEACRRASRLDRTAVETDPIDPKRDIARSKKCAEDRCWRRRWWQTPASPRNRAG